MELGVVVVAPSGQLGEVSKKTFSHHQTSNFQRGFWPPACDGGMMPVEFHNHLPHRGLQGYKRWLPILVWDRHGRAVFYLFWKRLVIIPSLLVVLRTYVPPQWKGMNYWAVRMQAPPTALIFSSATLLKNLGTKSTMRTVCQATRSSQGLIHHNSTIHVVKHSFQLCKTILMRRS